MSKHSVSTTSLPALKTSGTLKHSASASSLGRRNHPTALGHSRSDWMLPGGSVFKQRPQMTMGPSAAQTLLEVEAQYETKGIGARSATAALSRRAALAKQTAGGRSRQALRRMVAEQLGRDILGDFKSREFEVNPLVDTEDQPGSPTSPQSPAASPFGWGRGRGRSCRRRCARTTGSPASVRWCRRSTR